ncbi:MAG: hypothetical protein NTV34_10395 [Proteobacteria bacterium]|nr:hypothetical protein [Pseudomonadota bacterium]
MKSIPTLLTTITILSSCGSGNSTSQLEGQGDSISFDPFDRTGELADVVSLPANSPLWYFKYETDKLIPLKVPVITSHTVKQGPYTKTFAIAPTKILTDNRTFRFECKRGEVDIGDGQHILKDVCYWDFIGNPDAKASYARFVHEYTMPGAAASRVYHALDITVGNDGYPGSVTKSIRVGDTGGSAVDIECQPQQCAFTVYGRF